MVSYIPFNSVQKNKSGSPGLPMKLAPLKSWIENTRFHLISEVCHPQTPLISVSSKSLLSRLPIKTKNIIFWGKLAYETITKPRNLSRHRRAKEFFLLAIWGNSGEGIGEWECSNTEDQSPGSSILFGWFSLPLPDTDRAQISFGSSVPYPTHSKTMLYSC